MQKITWTLDELIAELTGEAASDDERILAFQKALLEHLTLPCDGFVIGELVSVLRFDYDGNQRRGLTAKCRRVNGREHVVAASEVAIPPQINGCQYLAAYRQWMGLEPYPAIPVEAVPPRAAAEPDLGQSVELAVLATKKLAARCRFVGSDRMVTLRTARLWDVVPGEVIVVKPARQWKYAGALHLSGKIESKRLDVAALGLVPLKLEDQDRWDPVKEYWGEKGEPIAQYAKPIIAYGPRRRFEMEQVLPGAPAGVEFYDPISDSNDLLESGDSEGAMKLLMDTCQADLRCLDAHAHLGNLVFEGWPEHALRHYEVGFRIGELTLGKGFNGVLPWGFIDNRPFLRCMHGFGLCLWRLKRFKEAKQIFHRMLWLNPKDNQGIRLLIDEVRAKVKWENSSEGASRS